MTAFTGLAGRVVDASRTGPIAALGLTPLSETGRSTGSFVLEGVTLRCNTVVAETSALRPRRSRCSGRLRWPCGPPDL